jgi:hypothetical protein
MKTERLIIGALGMITATIVASLGLTVAWYASGNILGVDTIEITFRGDKPITAGFDKDDVDNFKDTIAFNDEVNDKEYYPVSSMFSDDWLDIEASNPVFRGSYQSVNHDDVKSYTRSISMSDENGYFSKEIYLYCESNVIITLDSEGTTFTPDILANEDTAKQLSQNDNVETIEQDLNNVVKSLRLSVLTPKEEEDDEYNYYIIDPFKEEDTYLCGNLNLFEGGEYYHTYFKNNKEYETFFGEYNDESLLVYEENEFNTEVEGRPSEFNARHRKGTQVVNLEKSIENGFIPKKENSLSLHEADIANEEGKDKGVRIKLKAFEPKKIVLSMYLEGWDRDNVGYTQLGKFYSDIKFKIGEDYY